MKGPKYIYISKAIFFFLGGGGKGSKSIENSNGFVHSSSHLLKFSVRSIYTQITTVNGAEICLLIKADRENNSSSNKLDKKS